MSGPEGLIVSRMSYSWTILFLALLSQGLVAQERNFEEEFAKIDLNKNGLLEVDEIPGDLRRNVFKYAERAGLDPRRPLPINKLLEAIAARREAKAAEAGGTTPPASVTPPGTTPPATGSPMPPAATPAPTPQPTSTSNSPPSPKVPGFGEKDTAGKVPGFNVPLSTATEKPIELTFDPRVVERTIKIMRDYDRNNDGVLSGEELERGSFSNPPIGESDLNKDGKLTKYEMAERYRKRHDWNGPPGPASASSSSQQKASTPPSSAGSGEAAKVRNYAEQLLKQYDLNKSGVLEKDEWMQMKSEYHTKVDQNGDNVLTIDELVVKLGGGASSAGSSSTATASTTAPATPPGFSGSSERSGGSSSSGSSGAYPGISKATLQAAKKAGRFLTATERLPKGLPDWFLRNDADGDGQIMMSEYAAAWSDATAADFMKYDIDGDGVITPEECLVVIKKK